MAVSHLQCKECKTEYPLEALYVCEQCFGPLEVKYDHSDLDAETQRTLARGARLVKTLNQPERHPMPVEDQVIQIYAATNGFLDRIVVDKVDKFLAGLTGDVRGNEPELLTAVHPPGLDPVQQRRRVSGCPGSDARGEFPGPGVGQLDHTTVPRQ